MIKTILLGILILALLVSPAFAQGTECTTGETMCDQLDINYMWSCVNGYWAEQTFCPDECNPTTKMCNGMLNGESCTTVSETRCHPQDSDALQICEDDGAGNLEWRYYMSCNGLLCDTNANACFECSEATDSPSCSGNISNFCDSGYWDSEDCTTLIGGYCDAATGLCVSNSVCIPGERECIEVYPGDDLSFHECDSTGQWGGPSSCFPTEYCEDSTGLCVSRNLQNLCNAWEDGYTRCDPGEVIPATVEICQLASPGVYQWVPYTSCYLGENNDLGCFDGLFFGDAYCKECAVPGEQVCWTTDSWHVCEDDYKYSSPTFCAAEEVCQGGVCNPINQTNGTSCTLGAERCSNNNIIEKCKNISGVVDYYTDRACASDEYCEEFGSNPTLAVCREVIIDDNTGNGGSGSGGGMVSSGGGFMWHDETDCTSYTEWAVVSSIQFTKELNDGTTQECTDSSLERYCIQKNGETDTSRKETENKIDCGQKSDTCDYVYDRTEKFVDRNEEGMCRSCDREVYIYTCQPSGKTDYANIKESTTCANYGKCEAEFPTASTATQKGWVDILIDDWAVALGIILLLVIAGVVFLAYKMMDEDEEQGELE